MVSAKVRSLRVRPKKSADLSFNIPGVIAFRHPSLAFYGANVPGLNIDALYNNLGDSSDEGLLNFNAERIRETLLPGTGQEYALFALRSPGLTAGLERAIRRRQNAFLQRYLHQDNIIQKYSSIYPEKLNKISNLRSDILSRKDRIADKYELEGKTNVVISTSSKTNGSSQSEAKGSSKSEAESKSNSQGTTETKSEVKTDENSTITQNMGGTTTTKIRPMGYKSQGWKEDGQNLAQISRYREEDNATSNVKTRVDSDSSANFPAIYKDSKWQVLQSTNTDFESQKMESNNSGTSTSDGSSTSTGDSTAESTSESTTNSESNQENTSESKSKYNNQTETGLIEFRDPSIDNQIRFKRRDLELEDEDLYHHIFSLQVPHLNTIMTNELEMIDQEIKQLQVNYIHTFLTSPFSGLVTAVYKDQGESVQPGEPVIRIEEDEEIYLVGKINCRGRLSVGRNINITITDPFESEGGLISNAEELKLTGSIVAVRGHDIDNDEWNIIALCDNRLGDGTEGRKLPINYSFDYRNTSIEIS